MFKNIIFTIGFSLLFQLQHADDSIRIADNAESRMLGVFSSNEEYLKAFDLLIESSKIDIDNYFEFAQEVTLPSVKHFGHFLDIGPGSGQLTKLLGEKFKKITLIDNKDEALDNFNNKDFPNCLSLEKINQSVSDINLNKEEFDLITLSHVLYYVPKTEWKKIINNCFHALKKDGIIVITLNDEGEKQSFLTHFGGEAFKFRSFSEAYAKSLSGKAKVTLHTRQGGILTNKLENLVEVAGFYLMDAQRTASYQECEDYLLNRPESKTDNEEYKLTCNQLFLVIQKI